jgi:CHAD domain-containing protein
VTKLAAELTLDAAMRMTGLQTLAEIRLNREGALAGEIDAVHAMRVSIRRLRSVVSAAKPILAPRQYRWSSVQLKWLGDILGSARNWDVFTTELLNPLLKIMPADHDLAPLAVAAERERKAAYRKMHEWLRSERYAATTAALECWFDTGGWLLGLTWPRDLPFSSPLHELSPALLERRRRRVRKLSRNFVTLSDDERHQLRIALKKLRYVIELFGDIFDQDDVSTYLQLLKPPQAILGFSNDVRIASGLIQHLSSADGHPLSNAVTRAEGFLLGWHERGLAEQDVLLRRHIERIRRAKPFWR